MATIKSQMALNDGMSIVLKHIIKNMQTLNGSFIAMQQSCDEAVHIKNFEAASASLSEQIALAERLTNGYGEATEMEERLNQNIQTGTAAANGMLSSVKKLVSAFGIATGVKKAIDLSDQMSSTRARLSLIADDSQAASVADGIMEKTAGVQNMGINVTVDDGGSVEALEAKIMASAQRSRAAYLDTASAIASMGANAGAAFSGNDELIAFMEQVNKQFVIGGASAQGQSAAMLQLTQAMDAPELPGLLRAIWASLRAASSNTHRRVLLPLRLSKTPFLRRRTKPTPNLRVCP